MTPRCARLSCVERVSVKMHLASGKKVDACHVRDMMMSDIVLAETGFDLTTCAWAGLVPRVQRVTQVSRSGHVWYQ